MITTIHVRGASRDAVIQQIKARMEEEGYVEDPSATPTHGPFDTSVRQIVIVDEGEGEGMGAEGKGEWIGIVDHPFARTAWAERLSRTLGTQAVELGGECDHAFYSDAKLFDRGEAAGESRVPADAVLEEDGRHRIRPTFLAAIAPQAKAVLEAGIVVNPHGGEENVVAVGEALGIPRPLVHSYDGDDFALVFRQVKEEGEDTTADLLESEKPFDMAAMMSQLAKSIGASLGEDALPVGADGNPDLSGLFEKLIGGRAGEAVDGAGLRPALDAFAPAELDAVFLSVSPRSGIVGADLGGFTFEVSLGSTALRVKGLEFDVWGDGLALLDPFDAIETFPMSLTASDPRAVLRAESERVETDVGLVQRFRFPDAELTLSEKARKRQKAKAAKPSPFGLTGTFNLGMMAVEEERARICFNVSSTLPRPGQGEIHVRVRLAEIEPAKDDGPALAREASASATLDVRAAARRPVLPSFVELDAHQEHYLEEYASRKCLNGWVGFAAPWSDVAARVLPMIHDLVKMLRDASGLALGTARVHTNANETLTFEKKDLLDPRDPTWAKIEAELKKGAEISLDDSDRYNRGVFCVRDGGEEPPEMTIALAFGHCRDGASPGWPATNVDGEPIDRVRVYLRWTISRPTEPKSRALASEVSRSIVVAAGHVPGSVGGYVTTGSYSTSSSLDLPFSELMGLRGVAEKQTWCESHIRTPAWCVLAPDKAARRLAGRETPARLWTSRTTHGLLVCSSAADPFVFGPHDAEAIERFVLPVVGTAEELAAVRS